MKQDQGLTTLDIDPLNLAKDIPSYQACNIKPTMSYSLFSVAVRYTCIVVVQPVGSVPNDLVCCKHCLKRAVQCRYVVLPS